MLLDLSSGAQSYIEDCEVCCRPVRVSYAADEGELTEFEAEASDL